MFVVPFPKLSRFTIFIKLSLSVEFPLRFPFAVCRFSVFTRLELPFVIRFEVSSFSRFKFPLLSGLNSSSFSRCVRSVLFIAFFRFPAFCTLCIFRRRFIFAELTFQSAVEQRYLGGRFQSDLIETLFTVRKYPCGVSCKGMFQPFANHGV